MRRKRRHNFIPQQSKEKVHVIACISGFEFHLFPVLHFRSCISGFEFHFFISCLAFPVLSFILVISGIAYPVLIFFYFRSFISGFDFYFSYFRSCISSFDFHLFLSFPVLHFRFWFSFFLAFPVLSFVFSCISGISINESFPSDFPPTNKLSYNESN